MDSEQCDGKYSTFLHKLRNILYFYLFFFSKMLIFKSCYDIKFMSHVMIVFTMKKQLLIELMKENNRFMKWLTSRLGMTLVQYRMLFTCPHSKQLQWLSGKVMQIIEELLNDQ